jgi:hypothetical protein
MVARKVYLNQDALGDQMNQLNQVVMILDAMKDDRLMDDPNYLAVLNFRDVLPCAYSLISIEN